MQDGLPESAINTLAQTPDGYLWIGTTGGLVRFDGVAFVVFNRENTPALKDNSVFTLFPSRDGGLWIGTDGGGLAHYLNGAWSSYQAESGLRNPFVRTVREDSHGVLWVGTDTALYRREGARFVEVPLRPDRTSVHIHTVFEDAVGRLWAAGTGAYVREPGETQFRPADDALMEMPFRAITQTADGTIWAATVSGVWQLPPGAARFRLVPELSEPVQTVYVDRNGILWVGTLGRGMVGYDGHRFTSWSEPNNRPGSFIHAVLEDAERNLWIGTQSGLIRWRPATVDTITTASGEPESLRTVYRDATGTVWAASSLGRLYNVSGHLLAPFPLPRQFASVSVQTVHRDSAGALWIGTEGDGAIRLEHGHATSYRWRNGMPNDFIRAFEEAPDGTMWVGTAGGLAHIAPDHIDNIQPNQGLAYFGIRALHFDRNGVLWIGTDNGLSLRQGASFLHNNVTERLRGEKIWAIHEDSGGAVWLGTRGGGLYRTHGNKVDQFTTRNGLASNEIFQVLEDRDANLWMSTPIGVFTLSRAALERTLGPGWRQPSVTLFGVSDGMETTPLTGGVQPAGSVMPNGELWFASARGVARFRGGRVERERLPSALIDQVVADGRAVNRENVVLGPGNGRLEIHYTAVALRSPERIHFRFRLDGIDTEWTEARAARDVHYANLPPGRYLFRVQAYDLSAPAVVSEAVLPILWVPHFYQRAWFLALLVLSGAGVVWWAHSARLRHARQRFALVLEERKRLARDMHDTLIQSCVGVSTLLEAAGSIQESQRADELMERAREQIRVTIDDARSAVWNLRQPSLAQETLAAKLADLAAGFRTRSAVPVRFSTRGKPKEVAGDLADNLYLVVREAIANALRHAAPAAVEVELRYRFRSLEITVSDNGSGFSPAAVASLPGRHYGLIGMRERVERLRGRFSIDSRPGGGTTIGMHVPLHHAPEGA
jgi:signal transduction histidine kinase/ligand-binding sensor domain-containing protein